MSGQVSWQSVASERAHGTYCWEYPFLTARIFKSKFWEHKDVKQFRSERLWQMLTVSGAWRLCTAAGLVANFPSVRPERISTEHSITDVH
jgi:hypothetical protein